MNSLSIIVPIYNEVHSLQNVLNDCLTILTEHKIDFEIIVVDDGSCDGSEKLISSFSGRDRFKIIQHPSNLGFGQALKSGLQNSSKDWILIIPGDGQFPAVDLVKLWNMRESGHIVCGARIRRDDSLFRKLASKIYNLFTKIVLGIDVLDIGWIKLYEKSFLQGFEISTTGFIIDTEIMRRAHLMGYKVKNIIVAHKEREFGNSKINSSQYFKIFKDLIKIVKIKNDKMYL